MKASVSVICYKHKVLANGESPLMLRIAKDGKRTMKSLGISVNPAYWDFGRNQPKNNCSRQDDELTRKITEAARLLDIKVADHIILTSEDFYSYNDEGRI